ncbi:MAG: SMC-Scp complex subunit ScpB [Alphaproteobacteria bacterium]|nr:SMC-Scp complex subunit ScpB [Alphaproteobacteria bacterium]
MNDRQQHLRLIEAVLFASAQPVDQVQLAQRLPEGADIPALLGELQQFYAERGIHLSQIAGKWAFRTAPDLAPFLRVEAVVQRRLSRASVETLAIIAYHQPVSRAEVEEIRGVALSKGTLDILLEAGWIKPAGRRETPGRPLTWRTTPAFLEHFGLNSLDDLPGLDDLKAAGLLERRPGFATIAMRSEEAEAAREEAARDEAAPSADEDAGEEVATPHEGTATKPPLARPD